MGNNKQLIDFITAENELDGQETVYIAQGGKTRKTLLQKIKEFIIGTNTMGTTATDVTGAVKELNDKIGSTEKEGSVIAQMNEKANLSDVKIFTSLSDIGLSLDDMTTDFGANILKMIKAMGRNRKLVLYPYSAETNTNLYNSVKTWCGLDTDAYTIVIESSFNGAENLPNKIEVYPNTNTGNNRYFVGFYDNAIGKCREVATTEIFNFESLLVNGWHVGNCSFRGKKIGNEMFIEGIIVNNLESPNKIIAQGLPIPSDGKWHGGSSMCSDNSSIYLALQPNGGLLFQQNGQKKDLLYTISINYPV